jgi:HAD superfamily hydrolase (TIGR01549 family)
MKLRRVIYKSLDPTEYSRLIWFKETFERLDDSMVLGIDMNKFIESAKTYETKYWKMIDDRISNYPETLKVLETLKSKKIKIATITDSDGIKGNKDIRIRNLGLHKYFDYIITGDEIGLNKPAPENWQKLLVLSGMKPGECIMVGDHPDIDLVTPKKLGFITVWTKEGLNNDLHMNYVDYEIKNIREILGIVGNINR